jgi:hypothetical protein
MPPVRPNWGPLHGLPPNLFHTGFFSVIFDKATRVARLAGWQGLGTDAVSMVRFTNTFIVTAGPVPEPRAAAILTAALFGLQAVAHATSLKPRRRRAR